MGQAPLTVLETMSSSTKNTFETAACAARHPATTDEAGP